MFYRQKQKSLTCRRRRRNDVVNEIHYSNLLSFDSTLMEDLFWTKPQARSHVIETNMPPLLAPRGPAWILTRLCGLYSAARWEAPPVPLRRPCLAQQGLPEAGRASWDPLRGRAALPTIWHASTAIREWQSRELLSGYRAALLSTAMGDHAAEHGWRGNTETFHEFQIKGEKRWGKS